MALPLAVDPGRVQRIREMDARRTRCRELLGQAFAAEPSIVTAAILGEVSEALNTWDNDRVEPLLTAIEKLSANTPEARRYFVKVDWDALRPPLVTPTPAPAVTSGPRETPAPTVAGPRTRIVAADGTEAYNSISKAIADSARGDVVMVRPGVYRELVVLRSGVRVTGAGPESTRLEPTEGRRFAVIALDCEDAVIEQIALNGRQLTLTNAYAIGLTYSERDGALYTDTVVAGGPAAAAGVPSGARVIQFNGRTVEEGDYWAVHQEANASAKVVLELDLNGTRQTIEVVPQMIGAMGDDQSVSGILGLRSSITMDQVIIRDFTYHGITLAGGTSTLRDARVMRTGGSGLQAMKGATVSITGGSFSDNAHCGILASNMTTNVTFEKGSIGSSGMTGALARLHAHMELREVSIDKSKGSGARTYDGAELVLRSVQITHSTGEGASADTAWLELHDCLIENSGSNGVLVWKQGGVLKSVGTTVRHSTKQGILSTEGARCFVERGLVELNGEGGIRIAAAPDFKLDGPTVQDNQFDGIAISNGANGHLENVTSSGNAGDGIAIWSPGTKVTNHICAAKSNGRYGYFISTGAEVSVDTTFADGNKDAGYAVSQEAVLTAADSNAADNVEEGYTIWSKGSLKAARCLVSGGETGFLAMSGARVELDRCEASKGTERGFAAYGSETILNAVGCSAREFGDGFVIGNGATGTARDSTSTGHVDTGIYGFGEGTNLTAIGNTVRASRIGIWIQDGAQGTVTGNIIEGTTGSSLGMHGEGTKGDFRDNSLKNNADGNNVAITGGAVATSP